MQFRCSGCGSSLAWKETKCRQCGKSFLSNVGVLDFVDADEALASERNHYDGVYNKTAGSDRKQIRDLKTLWEDPWSPQDRLVLESLGDIRGKRVLLLGNGHSTKELFFLTMNPKALIYSDLSTHAVANIRDEFDLSSYADSIEFAAVDAQKLPFADGSIDVIYGYAMVHHLPHLPEFLLEVSRVLAKDGYSVFFDDAYAPVWHYSKQTFLRPLMKYSHKTSGISPEDYRFSMSGGFREKVLAKHIEAAGGIPWFKRTMFLQFFWYRAAEKLVPKKLHKIVRSRLAAAVLGGIDRVCSRLPLIKLNLIRLVWGMKKGA